MPHVLTSTEVALAGVAAVILTNWLTNRQARFLARDARDSTRADWWQHNRFDVYSNLLRTLDEYDHFRDDLLQPGDDRIVDPTGVMTEAEESELHRLADSAWKALSVCALLGPANVEQAGHAYLTASLGRTLPGPVSEVVEARTKLRRALQEALGTPTAS